MPSRTDERASRSGIASGIREKFDGGSFASLFAGLLAGGGVSLLGADAVAVPAVGSVPGPLVGGAGVVAGTLVYLRVGRCGSCGGRKFGPGDGCGCSGECGDSCSYDS